MDLSKLKLQVAPTGRSACRCKERIKQGEVRLGIESQNQEFGTYYKWNHLGCVAPQLQHLTKKQLRRIDGYKNLIHGDREVVKKSLSVGSSPKSALSTSISSDYGSQSSPTDLTVSNPFTRTPAAADPTRSDPISLLESPIGTPAATDPTRSEPISLLESPIERSRVIDLTSPQHVGSKTVQRSADMMVERVLCSAHLHIVGMQHHLGRIYPTCSVSLLAEPNNPYDRNAIRVDNEEGDQVGHIKATEASSFVKFLNEPKGHPTSIKVQAFIPADRSVGTYSTVCCVVMSGPKFRQRDLMDTLSKGGIRAVDGLMEGLEYDLNNRVWVRLRPRREDIRRERETGFLGSSSRGPRTPSEPTVTSITFPQSQDELDKLYDSVDTKITSMIESGNGFKTPKTITSRLLPHQVYGCTWMALMEQSSGELPEFWEMRHHNGREIYVDSIMKSVRLTRPMKHRGGILADDMGLGKTLTVLSVLCSSVEAAVAASNPRPAPTLIVCPLSLIGNWTDQICQHVAPNTLTKPVEFSGPNRTLRLDDCRDADVVIVTYETLASDFKYISKQNKKRKTLSDEEDSITSIFDIKFSRIVLDEAHIIRNRETQKFKAVLHVRADCHWAVTGTPLQNSADDIYSLLAFLRYEPFLEWNAFDKGIGKPIKEHDNLGMGRLRTTLKSCSLRRTKAQANLKLPPKSVKCIEIPWNDNPHESVYNVLFESSRGIFQGLLQGGGDGALKHYSYILESLLRIRQAANDGTLIPEERVAAAHEVLAMIKEKKEASKNADSEESFKLTHEEGKRLFEKLRGIFSEDAGNDECCICLETIQDTEATALRKCGHVFCETCIGEVAKRERKCPLCRTEFRPSDLVKEATAADAAKSCKPESSDDDTSVTESSLAPSKDLGNSPKVQTLLDMIKCMPRDERGVIFSQFTKFLDVIEAELDKAGIKTCRIDGSTSNRARKVAIASINSDAIANPPLLILCSLKAAGVGLNLTRCNHIFLMDLWWNSAAEEQAQDRVYRIGQSRDVTVNRFVMQGGIESAIMRLQEAKAMLAKGVNEKLNAEELRKSRISTLCDIFDV